MLLVLAPLLGVGLSAVHGQTGGSGEAAGVRLDRLQRAVLGAALPPGWDIRPVRGFDAPESRVIQDETHGRVIRFEAEGEGAFFWLELADRFDPADGRLGWSWRVDRAIPTANLRDRDRDDSPARFFVVFGSPGLFSRPRMIFYTWANDEAVGDLWSSADDGRVKVVVLRNRQTTPGRWVNEDRDLADDYRRAFGQEPGTISAIGFMIDTDNAGEHAVSRLGPVRWTASEAFDHGDFDRLLQRHVTSDGLVDYDAFRDNAAFQRYLGELANAPLDRLSRDEQLALWINA